MEEPLCNSEYSSALFVEENYQKKGGEVEVMQNRNEVIISIKTKWCDLIISGLKVDEIRKTKPDLSHGPLRVLIYRTGGTGVIGEFTLRHLTYIQAWEDEVTGEKHLGNTFGLRHCVDDLELWEYLHKGGQKPGKPYPGGWAWRIENLIIYDRPMPLRLFRLKRPPQSWQYGVI